MHEERVVLVAEVEVPREMRLVQHVGRVGLHFEQVVLVLPDKGNVFELLDVVLVLVVLVGHQKVEYELLAPLYDAPHNMKRQHS